MQSMARLISADEDFGKDHGLIHEVVVTGRKAGAGRDFWSKLAHDESLFRRVVTLVGCNGYQPTTSQTQARAIMGANFFGVEEAIRHFGVNPSKQQLATLADVPFTEATLETRKDTHILAAVFPLSILDIHDKVERSLFRSHEDGWYNKEKFAKDKGNVGWQMVRKTSVPDSTLKTWAEQQALLSPDEQTPTAQVMAYTIIGHFKATGERLFENIYVRCSDLDSVGIRVRLGFFGQDGLIIYYIWDDGRNDVLGLASTMKFQN